MTCWIHERDSSDKEARPSGRGVIFQGKKLYRCKELREWICWGEYLVRWHCSLWQHGYFDKTPTYNHLPIKEIKEILIKYIGDIPYYDAVKFAEYKVNYGTLIEKKRYFYAMICKLNKEEVDAKSDFEIELFFIDGQIRGFLLQAPKWDNLLTRIEKKKLKKLYGNKAKL